MSKKKTRRLYSIKQELIRKSREAAIAAVQIFNNPSISFKTELFIVTMIIAWTYLMHAYYKEQGIDYRYYTQKGKRKRYDRTKRGAYKYWELERCLNYSTCPLSKSTVTNLLFLIGLRHEIEHQMAINLDRAVSAKLQSCCLNYNNAIKSLFGSKYGLDRFLSISLQFSSITPKQVEQLRDYPSLPNNIATYIDDFEGSLSVDELKDQGYAYRVLFVPILANRRGQADEVIEFIKADSETAQKIGKEYAVIKETEKTKYLPSEIVEEMKMEGYEEFNIHRHTLLWKACDGKNPKHNYGVLVAKQWYWYEKWLNYVRDYCKRHFS